MDDAARLTSIALARAAKNGMHSVLRGCGILPQLPRPCYPAQRLWCVAGAESGMNSVLREACLLALLVFGAFCE